MSQNYNGKLSQKYFSAFFALCLALLAVVITEKNNRQKRKEKLRSGL
jgi:sensor domain CHASE-containing protein